MDRWPEGKRFPGRDLVGEIIALAEYTDDDTELRRAIAEAREGTGQLRSDEEQRLQRACRRIEERR